MGEPSAGQSGVAGGGVEVETDAELFERARFRTNPPDSVLLIRTARGASASVPTSSGLCTLRRKRCVRLARFDMREVQDVLGASSERPGAGDMEGAGGVDEEKSAARMDAAGCEAFSKNVGMLVRRRVSGPGDGAMVEANAGESFFGSTSCGSVAGDLCCQLGVGSREGGREGPSLQDEGE